MPDIDTGETILGLYWGSTPRKEMKRVSSTGTHDFYEIPSFKFRILEVPFQKARFVYHKTKGLSLVLLLPENGWTANIWKLMVDHYSGEADCPYPEQDACFIGAKMKAISWEFSGAQYLVFEPLFHPIVRESRQ